MKIIRMLSDMIQDEIEGARDYIKQALEHKDEHRELADMLYSISTEELDHINRLHASVTKIIKDYRKEHGEPPVEMMAVYEYVHGKHIDQIKDIKEYQTMYKEM